MSIVINIKSDFNEYDLDDVVICDRVAKRIVIGNNKVVVLDISNCLIGYDATCKIIDPIIDALIVLPGDKSLVIITDYQFPEDIISSFLFRGSKYVDSGKMGRQDVKSSLRASLLGKRISISLEIGGKRVSYL